MFCHSGNKTQKLTQTLARNMALLQTVCSYSHSVHVETHMKFLGFDYSKCFGQVLSGSKIIDFPVAVNNLQVGHPLVRMLRTTVVWGLVLVWDLGKPGFT